MTIYAQKVTKIVELFRRGHSLEEVLVAGLTHDWSRTDVERVVTVNGWQLTPAGRLPSVDRKVTRPPVAQRAATRAVERAREPAPTPLRAATQAPLRVSAIAKELSVSTMTVYRLIQEGRIGHIRVGRSYRIPVDAYEKYLAEAYREAAS